MKFSTLSLATRAIWAKSSEDTEHGLLAHMLDVAAVVEELLNREPATTLDWAAQILGLPRAQAGRWLALFIGLHDFGKAIPGFQKKSEPGAQRCVEAGLSFPAHACNATVHSCATAVLLQEPLQGITPAASKWLRHVVRAISAHHGFHIRADELKAGRPTFEPSEWRAARSTMLRVYWDILAPEGAPSLKKLSLPGINWIAGLTSAADWIASNPEWFPLGERRDDLRDYYQHARRLAVAALDDLGWYYVSGLMSDVSDTDTDVMLARIVGRSDTTPRQLQEVGDRLLRTVAGPALMLVEAPMGEGKTELAFLSHLRLQAANAHRGLYIALPTQATGNAMFTRVLDFLKRFAGGPLDVQLAHGGAAFNEQAKALRTVYLEGIDHDNGETLSASSWFGQRRRPLLSAYGVGTVDQALYATLNVKHHFVRLWGLSNRVVVLDEVHAYDTYTSGLIASLLKWLKAMGSSVVLMSATLPRSRRHELLGAWGVEGNTIPEVVYPRVFLADQTGVRVESFHSRKMAPIRLAGLSPDLESMATTACELARDGGCGAIIVNTVDRAQQLYTLLRDKIDTGVTLLLFHAGFPMDARIQIEKRVLSFFGPAGRRPERAILVATQVAEQSLDIDVDFMLSDLAPIDLLLQRAGRLHRHDRQRPVAHRDARLWVAGLTNDFPDLKATRWEFVYEPYILGRTWALLGQEDVLDMPGDIDRLVQAVYGDTPLPEALDPRVAERIEMEYWPAQTDKDQNHTRVAVHAALDADMELESAYEGKPQGADEDDLLGFRNVTRLGEKSIALAPVDVVDGGWRIGDTVFDPEGQISDDVARNVYERQLRVSRKAVERHFSSKELPPAFVEHPFLRQIHPLPLEGGVYTMDGVSLRLDAELGLIYETEEIR